MDIDNLIIEAQRNNKQAFGELVKYYQKRVYFLAFRLMACEEDAQDIAQEAFVKAWINIAKYNPRYKFITWLFKITSNLCYDKLRQSKQHVSEYAEIKDYYDLEKEIINKETALLITQFTNTLTPKQRLVFTLKDMEGLETFEIEQITGLSPAKIKSNLYLARKVIKQKLNNLNTDK